MHFLVFIIDTAVIHSDVLLIRKSSKCKSYESLPKGNGCGFCYMDGNSPYGNIQFWLCVATVLFIHLQDSWLYRNDLRRLRIPGNVFKAGILYTTKLVIVVWLCNAMAYHSTTLMPAGRLRQFLICTDHSRRRHCSAAMVVSGLIVLPPYAGIKS